MNINFIETIHEVDEEDIISELNRKESCEKAKNLKHDNVQIITDELKFTHGKRFNTEENQENGISVYSPFSTENLNNPSKVENGLQNLIQKSKNEKVLPKKIEFRNKKSKSETIFNKVRVKGSDKCLTEQNNCGRKVEKMLKSLLEVKDERLKRLRDIKNQFSQSFNSKVISSPSVFDFSILKLNFFKCREE